MKILQVIPYFPPAYSFGGPAKVVYDISQGLVRRNNEVVVYTSDALNSYSRMNFDILQSIKGMKIYYMRTFFLTFVKKYKLFITPELLLRIKKDIKKFKIIHLHEYRTFQNVIIAHYARKFGVPYILQAHGSLPRIMDKQRLKRIYDKLFGYAILKYASKVIALNQKEATQYLNLGISKEKIAIIPNGINLSEYSNFPSSDSFKKRFRIKPEDKLILYLGRIHRIKGIDILIKAFAEIIKQFDNVKLLIAGPDDGYLSEIQLLINNLKIKNQVLICGSLYGKEKLEAYLASDVYVLPSRYETFPVSLLEAYINIKPVIASNVGSLKDLIINGETGFLFEPENVSELANYLRFAIENPDKMKKMGYAARRFVTANFSIDDVCFKLEKLFRNTINL